MITSEVDICNLAISWLGGELIFSLDDESDEAHICKANYESCRDTALEAREWTFAGAGAKLNPETTAPVVKWDSQFVLPPDCLRVRRVCSDFRMQNNTMWEKQGNRIFANYNLLYLEYTQRVKDVIAFSEAYIQCLAALLASNISVPLTNSLSAAQKFQQDYVGKLAVAGAQDGSQGKNEPLRACRLVGVRYSYSGPRMPY